MRAAIITISTSVAAGTTEDASGAILAEHAERAGAEVVARDIVADDLALIPVTNKRITEFYPTAEIAPNTYRWQPNALSTVAVKAVLVSFDFRHLDCDHVGRFAQIVASNMGWLAENGHAKWKSVQLDYPLKGWQQYDCVRRYLGHATAPTTAKASANPVLDAIKNALRD